MIPAPTLRPVSTLRRPRRRGRAALAVGLVVLAMALLAGCTTIRGLIDTEDALRRAGFTDVDVGFDSNNGFDQVQVTVRPPAGELTEGGAEAQAESAAEVVWTTFPLRFDLLRVDVLGASASEGSATSTFTYSELAETFGPRPPGLDDKELGHELLRVGVGAAIVLVVGGLVFTAAVVLAIVMGVRSSRRRTSVTPPPWPPVVR